MENLSIFKVQELYSTPSGIKFTIFRYGNLILVNAHTYNIEELKYGVEYKCTLPYDCYDTSSAMIGNKSSSGQFYLTNNVMKVQSTSSISPLINTFMGQLVAFLKN